MKIMDYYSYIRRFVILCMLLPVACFVSGQVPGAPYGMSTEGCLVAPATPGAITLSAVNVEEVGIITASVGAVSGATSYVWTLPNGLTGSSTGPSINIEGTRGMYTSVTISVKAVNSCGESSPRSSSITVCFWRFLGDILLGSIPDTKNPMSCDYGRTVFYSTSIFHRSLPATQYAQNWCDGVACTYIYYWVTSWRYKNRTGPNQGVAYCYM